MQELHLPISSTLTQDQPIGPEHAVRVFGPASLSNLGPGFDTLGLCLDGIGDIIRAWRVEEPGLTLRMAPGEVYDITLDPEKNTAGVAAKKVMDQLAFECGVVVEISKGFKPGSGIGSSAASAVGAAWAVNQLAAQPLEKAALVEAVIAGEAVASGARHGDNVLPALFGGLVLVSSNDPTMFRPIPVDEHLWIALVLPEIEVLTKEARALLPVQVPLRDAVNQASALAFMIDAFRAGDWQTVGLWMMRDVLAEPVRSKLVPCYAQIKTAALEAGAFGCALTGSGPAMYAVSDARHSAQKILEAMLDACQCTGVQAAGYLSQANPHGAALLSSPDARN